MTTEKMTIHKALAELKTLDSRIANAMCGQPFVRANKHSNDKINGMTVASAKDEMRSHYQKVMDLIKRRDAMKRAVVLSNASTQVMIGNKEYTVAEAIELHQHGIENKRDFMNLLNNQLINADSEIQRNSSEALERRAESYILSVIGAQPKESKMSVDSEAMQALRKTYIENNTYDMIDPLDVRNLVAALEAEISEFETEVDAALSVSNALTVVEFSY